MPDALSYIDQISNANYGIDTFDIEEYEIMDLTIGL